MGPLAGVRVVETTDGGEADTVSKRLTELGAERLSIVPVAEPGGPRFDPACDSRTVAVDFRSTEATEIVRQLIAQADVFVQCGSLDVAEDLGIGDESLFERNPQLILARHRIADGSDAPSIPDVHALALGVVAALYEAEISGLGQVVDGLTPNREPQRRRTYRTSDGRYMDFWPSSVEATSRVLAKLRVHVDGAPYDVDPARSTRIEALMRAAFALRTQQEWAATFQDSQLPVEPVPSTQRFSRTPSPLSTGTDPRDLDCTLLSWGFLARDVERLRRAGAVR